MADLRTPESLASSPIEGVHRRRDDGAIGEVPISQESPLNSIGHLIQSGFQFEAESLGVVRLSDRLVPAATDLCRRHHQF